MKDLELPNNNYKIKKMIIGKINTIKFNIKR